MNHTLAAEVMNHMMVAAEVMADLAIPIVVVAIRNTLKIGHVKLVQMLTLLVVLFVVVVKPPNQFLCRMVGNKEIGRVGSVVITILLRV